MMTRTKKPASPPRIAPSWIWERFWVSLALAGVTRLGSDGEGLPVPVGFCVGVEGDGAPCVMSSVMVVEGLTMVWVTTTPCRWTSGAGRPGLSSLIGPAIFGCVCSQGPPSPCPCGKRSNQIQVGDSQALFPVYRSQAQMEKQQTPSLAHADRAAPSFHGMITMCVPGTKMEQSEGERVVLPLPMPIARLIEVVLVGWSTSKSQAAPGVGTLGGPLRSYPSYLKCLFLLVLHPLVFCVFSFDSHRSRLVPD